MNGMRAVAALLGVGTLMCHAVQAQSRKPISAAVFFSGEIVSPASNKCLDVTDESVRDGAAIQQWTCARQPNQLWNIHDQGNGEYAIVSQRSKKALDASVDSDDGVAIVQNDFQDVDNQRWRLEPVSAGTYHIINARSRKCIDLDGGKTDDGAKIQQWSCKSLPHQAWLLRK